MSKKNQKLSAAEDLIDSLMNDLQDIESDDETISGSADENFDAESLLEENNLNSDPLWQHLEEAIEKDIVKSEFSVGEDLPVAPADAEDSVFDGPSLDGGYQSLSDIHEAPAATVAPVVSVVYTSTDDKTISLPQDAQTASVMTHGGDGEKTVAVDGFANARLGVRRPDVDVKVSVGNFRGGRGAANVMTSVDASLAQSENLKVAQQRILELEKEVESLRAENEELASAGEVITSRADELGIRITALEKEKNEVYESAQSEALILKGNLQYKESEFAKAQRKVEELETRLKSDFKKIRVRERELENRLELLRAEKSALVRSKDEYILEQKRKIDQLSQELDNYRKKCLELNKTIEANQDQVKRTERALRLALSNLEAKEENFVPLKKAE